MGQISAGHSQLPLRPLYQGMPRAQQMPAKVDNQPQSAIITKSNLSTLVFVLGDSKTAP